MRALQDSAGGVRNGKTGNRQLEDVWFGRHAMPSWWRRCWQIRHVMPGMCHWACRRCIWGRLPVCCPAPDGLAAQDVSRFSADGVYTGEVSAAMLADCGCREVLLGHSERRQYFGEDDASLRLKVEAVYAAGLLPVVCVGESLSERAAGNHLAFVAAQLKGCGMLSGRAQVCIAYEPVWAISIVQVAWFLIRLPRCTMPSVKKFLTVPESPVISPSSTADRSRLIMSMRFHDAAAS